MNLLNIIAQVVIFLATVNHAHVRTATGNEMEEYVKPREFAESMALKMKGIIESGEAAMPICCAHRQDTNEMLLIGIELPNEYAKDMAALAIKMLARTPEIDYVIFLTDAWMKSMKQEEYQKFTGSLKNVPDRQEAIIASIYTKAGTPDLGSWVYAREDGLIKFTEKMKWHEPSFAEGRFIPENPRNSKSVQ